MPNSVVLLYISAMSASERSALWHCACLRNTTGVSVRRHATGDRRLATAVRRQATGDRRQCEATGTRRQASGD